MNELKEIQKQHRKDIRSRETIIKRQDKIIKNLYESNRSNSALAKKYRHILSTTSYKEIDYLYKLVKEYAPAEEEERYWKLFRS